MSTYALRDYSPSNILNRVFARAVTEPKRVTSFSGPSPFDVPESVQLTVESPHRFVFQFAYSDLDKPESKERVASEDGHTLVRLGENTKKILTVRFDRDFEDLIDCEFSLDEQRILPFLEYLSKQAMNSFRQNLAVIKLILNTLPKGFIDHVRQMVSTNG